MSLAELLVAMGLLLVVGGVLTATAVLTLRTGTGVQNRLTDSTQGAVGASAVSKVLRTAVFPAQVDGLSCGVCTADGDPALRYAAADAVDLYANVGSSSGPSRVAFYLDDRPSDSSGLSLVQLTQPARRSGASFGYCSSGPDCVSTRVVARGITGRDVFTYYDDAGVRLGNGSALSTAQRGRVTSVELTLAVRTRAEGEREPGRTTVTRIRLPNAQIAAGGQS